MKQIFVGLVAATVMLLGACTVQIGTRDGHGTFTEHPDGTIEGTWTESTTNTTITVNGTSTRQIVRQIRNPRMDDVATDYQIQYRYEYSFDIFDINGNLADTIAVGSLADALELLPAFFDVGGMPVPSAETITELENLITNNWVDPAVHWALNN